jgi:adenylosuccinate synthase
VAPGVVLNPPTVLGEIDALAARGVEVAGNLMISDRAHVVFPWHLAEDRALNSRPVEGENLGTTLRGIGPCYRDKVGRSLAIRLGDMYRQGFADRIQRVVAAKKQMLASLSEDEEDAGLDAGEIYEQFCGYAQRLAPYVGDTTDYLLDAAENGRRILLEGAQGALLDIDHGTFPFVTSSNSSGAGVSAGSGIPACWINKVIGVAKCYTTRVGGGPFPTEQDNEIGQRIREVGREYGTTTGRPRRCGWFDAVAVRYTARLSGVDSLFLTMLDVLSQLEEVKVCVAYELDGARIERFPSHVDDLRRATPVYETFPGWMQDVGGARTMDELPTGARRFLERISQLLGRPVEVVSVGPDREQTVYAQQRGSD